MTRKPHESRLPATHWSLRRSCCRLRWKRPRTHSHSSSCCEPLLWSEEERTRPSLITELKQIAVAQDPLQNKHSHWVTSALRAAAVPLWSWDGDTLRNRRGADIFHLEKPGSLRPSVHSDLMKKQDYSPLRAECKLASINAVYNIIYSTKMCYTWTLSPNSWIHKCDAHLGHSSRGQFCLPSYHRCRRVCSSVQSPRYVPHQR